MSQNLDKIFKQIQKNSEQMAVNAMVSAANQAFKLAKQEANKCLKTYLQKKPKIYKRLHPSPLKNAVGYMEPQLTEKGGKCTITFAVKYDSNKIKGVYKSNSWWHQSGNEWISRFDEKTKNKFDPDSQANGIPDSGWILNNYLEGIHPGYDRFGVDHGWKDATSPSETMRKFIEEELPNKASGLIYEAMQGAIIDFIKTNGGGR